MGNGNEKIAVLTDSNSDMPAGWADGLPLFVLPMRITDGEREYHDGVDITVEDIYRRQQTETFRTSMPSPEEMQDMLRTIRDRGFGKVVVLLISDALSGASNVFRMLAGEIQNPEIAVYNSTTASVGCGILASEAARYAASGISWEEMKTRVEQLIRDTYVFFSVDTLEYLKRGGRIGRVTELLGTMLNIKPVLSIDKEGVLYTEEKVRGRRLAVKKLLEHVERLAKEDGRPYNLVVCDGNVPEEGAALEESLRKLLPDSIRLLHGQVSATLGVHLGPGLLGAGIQFLEPGSLPDNP